MKRPKFQYQSPGRGDPVLNGAAIKQYRLAKKVSGKSLAIHMGFNPSTISYYESAGRKINEAVFVEYLEAVDAVALRTQAAKKAKPKR